jgi:hypothetical protein
MSFDLLKAEVEKGLEGKNGGIPMGFDRLSQYVGIRKGLFYLVGGLTGSGKTTFVDDAFVLNPYDWSISEEGRKSGIKIRFWYRSMERSTTYKFAKWVSRKIFIDQGIIIPVNRLLGWTQKMTHDEHDLFLCYEDYMKELQENIIIYPGAENPVGIAKDLKKYALTKGTIEELDEYNRVYVPNDPNEITIVVIDHIGLLKTTKDQPTKKEAIDKMSSELQYARDFYGFSPVVVSQFNRSISNPMRIKNGDVEPQLEDFAESSSTQNDADVIMALFDPLRYNVPDVSGYNLDKLRDEYGNKYFRSLRVIKNTYGADDLRIGLGFFGQIGMFKELKKRKDMTDADYADVISKSYFLR